MKIVKSTTQKTYNIKTGQNSGVPPSVTSKSAECVKSTTGKHQMSANYPLPIFRHLHFTTAPYNITSMFVTEPHPPKQSRNEERKTQQPQRKCAFYNLSCRDSRKYKKITDDKNKKANK